MKNILLILTSTLLFACGDKSKQEKDKELTICDCYEFAIDWFVISSNSAEEEINYLKDKYVQYDENGEEFVPCFSSG